MQKKIGIVLVLLGYILLGCSANIAEENEGSDSNSSPYYGAYNDGPYALIEGDKIIGHSIVDGRVVTTELVAGDSQISFPAEQSVYEGVKNVAAISDIHGQHDIFINILKRHHIIDDELNWSFGDGHFVIVGDIFDRGPQVLDALWFVFNLEEQAALQGGKVHYLLGNHEYMVLQGRLRYLHDNYNVTSILLDTKYQDLFGTDSLLGGG